MQQEPGRQVEAVMPRSFLESLTSMASSVGNIDEQWSWYRDLKHGQVA
jgi:hypothetical protein